MPRSSSRAAVIRSDSVQNLMTALDEETYLLTVRQHCSLSSLQAFQPVAVDAHSFKVTLKKERLHALITGVDRAGMTITDIHPQGHRLERLFLQILKE